MADTNDEENTDSNSLHQNFEIVELRDYKEQLLTDVSNSDTEVLYFQEVDNYDFNHDVNDVLYIKYNNDVEYASDYESEYGDSRNLTESVFWL